MPRSGRTLELNFP